MKSVQYLDPGRKLVDEVADWLCARDCGSGRGRLRVTPEGAISLDHVMVVVPTAQSGRSLRLAIARRFEGRGVIPPRIVQPAQLVVPAESPFRAASATEVAAAFQQYVKAGRETLLGLDRIVRPEEFDDLTARFSLLDQLEDIWRVLAGRGLLMRDVAEIAADAQEPDFGDEAERWRQLSVLEGDFFAFLHGLGLAYPTELVSMAKERAAIVPVEVEDIVLPALADPLRVLEDVLRQQLAAGRNVTVLCHAAQGDRAKFDEWGRPVTEQWTGRNRPVLPQLADDDISVTADSSSLARALAADYPDMEGDEALPALALCDGNLFESVSGAFLNMRYVVHNPEKHLLAQSSLGRMLRSLIRINGGSELLWADFVEFFRNDDVLSALGLGSAARARVLTGLDIAQNAYVPLVVPGGFSFPDDSNMRTHDRRLFDEFCEKGREVERVIAAAKSGAALPGFLRSVLKWVFAGRSLSRGASEKEFEAAAESVRGLLNALEEGVVASLPMSAKETAALAMRELGSAFYSLEPDAPDAIRTAGWLELAWNSADRIALAGLHEGNVPDSVVGHPFLPDSLRKKLGLVANDDRMARDSWLMKELVSSHAPHSVRAYVARADDSGDICRPSRLLCLCDDGALPARVARLFGDIPLERRSAARKVDWNMRLPESVASPAHFSPSAIDVYVKCPFNYLLKYGLRMNPYKEKRELEANDFGTLAHAALEMFAKDQIGRGDDQLTDASEILDLFRRDIFPTLRAKYGRTTLNIELQLSALEGRLALFSEVQADWAARGWRIRMAEREIPSDLEVPGLGFRVHGFVDRVDENVLEGEERPWCVIDYKTWDRKSGMNGHVYTTGRTSAKNEAHLRFAQELGYPLVKDPRGRQRRRMLSVQLPVYGKCLAALEPGIEFSSLRYRYLILGRNKDETVFCELKDAEVSASVETAVAAVGNIRRNIFWPPGPGDEWKYDFGGLFVSDPVADIGDGAWARAHGAKREAADG